MKNYRTPRTLSECQFDVGYPIFADTPKLSHAGSAYAAIIIAAIAAIAWISL